MERFTKIQLIQIITNLNADIVSMITRYKKSAENELFVLDLMELRKDNRTPSPPGIAPEAED